MHNLGTKEEMHHRLVQEEKNHLENMANEDKEKFGLCQSSSPFGNQIVS